MKSKSKSKSKVLYLDFEFNRVLEENVCLVSCATFSTEDGHNNWWLYYDEVNKERLRNYLNNFTTFVSYNAVAEARSFYSLGLDPLKYEWIDLFLEYRCLSNHNDFLKYGNQLVDGKIKMTFKPKPSWEMEEGEEELPSHKQTHSLAEAVYKLLGKVIDTEEKDKMRDLILIENTIFSEEEKKKILAYGESDVVYLPQILTKMTAMYKKLDPDSNSTGNLSGLLSEMKLRGKYSALTSIMESKGYPIDFEKTQNFSKQTLSILYDCQREINSLFPEIHPFRWDKANNRYSWDQIGTRKWIKDFIVKSKESGNKVSWEKTETGQLSLSLEAFTKYFNYSHDYPLDNFGAQMVRYLKLKQSLYGFVPSLSKNKKSFWDYVNIKGDKRARPYFNIYGAQSSRSQPAASGFMFLKPAWMRALVQPKEGYAICGVDYGSQEFFISALLAKDEEMINAYLSGDVYLAFAKSAGICPEDATKESHKLERNFAKSLVLGMSYLMSKVGLSIKLTQDLKKEVSEDEAQEYIDTFYDTYKDLKKYQEKILSDYVDQGFLKLPCGWYMWGDNPNERSVANFPIQGLASSIMRKAVEMCFEKDLYVCLTLHDAIYIEYKIGEEGKIKTLIKIMRDAFAYYFKLGDYEDLDYFEYAKKIKLDPFAWSPNYEKDSELDVGGIKIPCSNLYIDERAKNDYDKFSKYFELDKDIYKECL